ncbi:hypothetical protein L9G16_11705 [Shewanella sp. A25]|nr:hypothetical protein [Shewanella shenzhenensis]
MKKLGLLASIFMVGVGLSGCSSVNYYVVDSTFRVNEAQTTPPIITKGTDFSASFHKIKTIAVKAPDHCISESQTERSGNAKAETNVMQTACGVEMAQIERSLAKAGYGVISWKVLQNEMQVAKTHLEAATQLQADALFQINSLERSTSKAGQDARWERRYQETDAKLRKQKAAAVTPAIASQLDNIAKRNEMSVLGANEVLSATINSSVTLVENGRAIWFYEWNHQQSLDNNEIIETKTAIYCEEGFCNAYSPLQEQDSKPELLQGSSEALSTGASPADRRRAIHDKLMRQVVEDMVSKFSL